MKNKILNMIQNRIDFLADQELIAILKKDKVKQLEINSRIAELRELDIEIIKQSTDMNSKANKK